MISFDFWSLAYRLAWASKTDLQTAVSLGDLTTDEYYTITGEPYPV